MKELSKQDSTKAVLWLLLTALNHVYSEGEQAEQNDIKMYSTVA